MRLIDADALNKELQKRLGSPTDDKLYEVNLCIINAPTIYAIPVEWLEHMMTATTLARTSNAIKDVLALWKRMGQQKQEAR